MPLQSGPGAANMVNDSLERSFMSRSLAAVVLAVFLIAAVDGPPAPAGRGCGGNYIVVRGDTLVSVARRCESSVAELAQENGGARLEAGQRLIIPGIAPPARPAPPAPPREDAGIYRFQAGDTLYSLARWSRVTLRALLGANPGVDPAQIDVGDPIRLPRGAIRPEPMRLRERGPRAAAPPLPRPPVVAPPRARPAPPADDSDKPGREEDGEAGAGDEDEGSQPDGM